MYTLIIRRNVFCSQFGLKGWAEEDYKKPILFNLKGAVAKIFLDKAVPAQRHDFYFSTLLKFELRFSKVDHEWIIALKSKGDKSYRLAIEIYDIFKEMYEKLEAGLRVFGGTKNLFWLPFSPYEEFFSDWFGGVKWEIEGKATGIFSPKIPKSRKLFDLYKSGQLITPAKWEKVQQGINRRLPTKDILQLYQIWSKMAYNERRFAVIEAAILIEKILKCYALEILKNKGFSNSKIKNLQDELSFNVVLNLILPLSISKSESKKLLNHISKLDELRKVRNAIVHDDLPDEEIDNKIMQTAIESGIFIFRYIDAKTIKGLKEGDRA
ncbi:MAG: hypothetical protein PHS34_08570 [Candidatus Omnitrophica bacterium]|nr:hypothetical protein [Candidatus Omnitrophota bacterium]MDD5551299.1 hypothetical protein [Candidatus Omnitrophota bacterium]